MMTQTATEYNFSP